GIGRSGGHRFGCASAAGASGRDSLGHLAVCGGNGLGRPDHFRGSGRAAHRAGPGRRRSSPSAAGGLLARAVPDFGRRHYRAPGGPAAGADGRRGGGVRGCAVLAIRGTTVTPVTQITPPRLVRIGSWLAIPVHMRGVLYVAIASLCVVAVGVATLSMGDLGVAPHESAQVLSGTADGPSAFGFDRLRGPRLVVAIGARDALAVVGGLFQTVTRNPLGSPDIIGLASGAGAGAAAATLLWPGVVQVPAGDAAVALIAG